MSKKVLSAVLCGALMLSIAGCSSKGSITPDALYSYAKSDGAVAFDSIDDIEDAFEDDDIEEETEDNGLVMKLNVDDLMDLIDEKGGDMSAFNEFANDDMDEITLYLKRPSSNNQITAVAASFENEDDAEDYYDKYASQISMYSSFGAEIDEGEDGGIEYSTAAASYNGEHIGMAVYTDGSNVLIIAQMSNKGLDEIYDMCDGLGLPMAESRELNDDDDDDDDDDDYDIDDDDYDIDFDD